MKQLSAEHAISAAGYIVTSLRWARQRWPILSPPGVDCGVIVGGILEGSPAWDGGLRWGDVITAVNAYPIITAADFSERQWLAKDCGVNCEVDCWGWCDGQWFPKTVAIDGTNYTTIDSVLDWLKEATEIYEQRATL